MIHPDLANQCRNLSHDAIITECYAYNASAQSKNKMSITCNYCKIIGHKGSECKKKAEEEKLALKHGKCIGNKNVLSLKNPSDDVGYQLGTAADFHVSGNEIDFYSYSHIPKTVRVAGGNQVTAKGYGNLFFPASDGETEYLQGAIHMPGQRNRILSTAKLEKQGFSIRWPSNYRDIELIRSDGTVCDKLRRIFGRFIAIPPNPDELQTIICSVNRDWHSILGHPGMKAQDIAMKNIDISNYKPSPNCDICTKVKITKCKGHGSLRTAPSFGAVIHMDLVGGQKSLSPTTTDKSIPNATWFLLAVDEFTSWRWAWPVYSKKTVPNKIKYLLQHFKIKFGITPVCINTDSGTEFLILNSEKYYSLAVLSGKSLRHTHPNKMSAQ
ncbi:hypothetical protein K3495_g9821 [Podosphaera aphanis]|nr:hypothetical protein K3495_g9821 [Podosphaera aphanis]